MKAKKIVKIALVFLCVMLSGCESMEMFEESVDRENKIENFSYPMAMNSGKTGEFFYDFVDGKVSLNVDYPSQRDFWVPTRTPEVERDADLETRIVCEIGKNRDKISALSLAITVQDEGGNEIVPYKTEADDDSCTLFFKNGTLPKNISVKYEAKIVFEGEEKSFCYTASLKSRNVSLFRLKALNALYDAFFR